jgi:manganese/zinc/iron transport system substrate-binding protein
MIKLLHTKKLFAVLGASLVVTTMIFAGGCAEERGESLEYPYEIVATTGMIGDVVKNVAGERGAVHVLMGEEVDPHLFRPTRADIARMQRTAIIFYNGLHLEGRMGDALVQLARTKPVYAVTELVDEAILLDDEEYEEAFDPHLWMDVSLWMEAVTVIVNALSELDPDGAEEYRSNADRYREELRDLDRYVREIMATIPRERRVLVTAHDAFGYFGAAYDIEVIGVQGISTESEAGLEEINSLVRFIVDRGITAIFAETTVPDRALMAIIEGAADHGASVTIGGELFSDAMGASGSYEGTYIGMIDHNATTIVRALGGEAPAEGFRGTLSR